MSSERQEYNENTPWWGEHVHRYHLVFPYLTTKGEVLDIACGNGFGSYILSGKTTEMVTGADISGETVAICKKRFSKENLRFEVIDGTNITYPDRHFGTIVSFETIEHTTEFKQMLSEFNRVLKKEGTAIISTPNFPINSPSGKVTNPYHTQEFTYKELKAILEETFGEVEISGQQYIRYKQPSFRNFLGQGIENLLYMRGFRKIPLSIQNFIMKVFMNKDMYPSALDYQLTKDMDELLKCKTFFAVCKKK